MPLVMLPTPAEVLRLLGRLDPAGVAAMIEVAGVRGWRFRECGCPVSRYVGWASGVAVRVSPERWETTGRPGGLVEWCGVPPPSVAAFIAGFDCGDYPGLEAASRPPMPGWVAADA